MKTDRRGFLKTVGVLAAAIGAAPQRILDIPSMPAVPAVPPVPDAFVPRIPGVTFLRASSSNLCSIFIGKTAEEAECGGQELRPGESVEINMEMSIFFTLGSPDEKICLETFSPGGASGPGGLLGAGGAGSYRRTPTKPGESLEVFID